MLQGYVLLMLKEYEYSIQNVDLGLIAIHNNKLNEDEKKYLKKYALILIEMSYKMLEQSVNIDKTRREINKISYSIENIDERIIQLFPLE